MFKITEISFIILISIILSSCNNSQLIVQKLSKENAELEVKIKKIENVNREQFNRIEALRDSLSKVTSIINSNITKTKKFTHGHVNVRKGRGLQFSKIKTLTPGSIIFVGKLKNGWFKVYEYKDNTEGLGFIKSELLFDERKKVRKIEKNINMKSVDSIINAFNKYFDLDFEFVKWKNEYSSGNKYFDVWIITQDGIVTALKLNAFLGKHTDENMKSLNYLKEIANKINHPSSLWFDDLLKSMAYQVTEDFDEVKYFSNMKFHVRYVYGTMFGTTSTIFFNIYP